MHQFARLDWPNQSLDSIDWGILFRLIWPILANPPSKSAKLCWLSEIMFIFLDDKDVLMLVGSLLRPIANRL